MSQDSSSVSRRLSLRMSLDQALEEERRELLRLLDNPSKKNPRAQRRTSPAPVSRSMPDGREASSQPSSLAYARHGSIAGIGVGISPSTSRRSSLASPLSPLASSSPWTNTPLSVLDSDDLVPEPEPDRRSSDSTLNQVKPPKLARNNRSNKPPVDLFRSAPHIALGGVPESEHPSEIVPPRSKTVHSLRSPARASDQDLIVPDEEVNMDQKGPSSSLSSVLKENNNSREDVRLAKDKVESADENSEYAETTEDDDDDSSSEDDIRRGPVKPRGRSKKADPAPEPPPGGWSGKRGPGPAPSSPSPARRGALDLFHELQEESELMAPPRRGRRRSVLSPGPRRTSVHPNTNFDNNTSAFNTPVGSDDEANLSDIKQAQNLSIYMSSVDNSIPCRAIRTIIRGDFPRFQQEAAEGKRRQRKYLVATDLSEESVYALEWTIGTILRDGDTLFAVYAIADDSAGAVELDNSVQIGDGAKVMQDTTDVVGKQTEKTALRSQGSSSLIPHALAAYFGSDSKSGSRSSSADTRALSRAEAERARAIEDISQTCVRLLRKTMLQVRVAVEAIHCKSPKHLLTEAIDGLEPTMVILGSRGRSALKGVLLGSFSNYIVMKSSVPVMVARKKLKKHSKKTCHVRLSNNLTTPRSLAMAKVD